MAITLVANDIYRSPRPQPSDFPEIEAKFRTIVSLEGLDEDNKERNEFWPVVRVYSRPITFWQIYFTGITKDYLSEIMAAISIVPKPLLIHCQQGRDRTGLVIATYRFLYCGWTKEQAMEEALKFGYRDWLNFGLNKTWEQV